MYLWQVTASARYTNNRRTCPVRTSSPENSVHSPSVYIALVSDCFRRRPILWCPTRSTGIEKVASHSSSATFQLCGPGQLTIPPFSCKMRSWAPLMSNITVVEYPDDCNPNPECKTQLSYSTHWLWFINGQTQPVLLWEGLFLLPETRAYSGP